MENERIPIGNATFALTNQCIYPSTQCFGGIVFSMETSNLMISIFVGGYRFFFAGIVFSIKCCIFQASSIHKVARILLFTYDNIVGRSYNKTTIKPTNVYWFVLESNEITNKTNKTNYWSPMKGGVPS